MIRTILTTVALCLLGCAGARAESLQRNVDRLAADVKDFLESKDQDRVAIGDFKAPDGHGVEVRTRFVELLSHALGAKKIRIDKESAFVVQGRLRLLEVDGVLVPMKKVIALQIVVDIVDRANKSEIQLHARAADVPLVRDPAAIATVLAVSTDLDGAITEIDRDAALRKALAGEPTLQLAREPFVAQPLNDDSLSIQIKASRPGVAPQLQELELKGEVLRARVQVGEEYQVLVTNRSEHEMAAMLEIDGLNMFHFSSLAPQPSFVLVPPGQTVTLSGWHRDANSSQAFRVALPEDAVATKLGLANKIGTITVAFARTWKKNEPPPKDEPDKNRGELGTDFGSPVDVRFALEPRRIGAIRRTISVRYEK